MLAFYVFGLDGENIISLLDCASDIFQNRLAVIFGMGHLVAIEIHSSLVCCGNGQERFAGLAFHRESFAKETYLIGFDRCPLTIVPNPIWRVGPSIEREGQEQEQAKMKKAVNSHAILR